VLAGEREDGRRVVLEGERFLAWIPFHARWPYETWLAPRAHQRSMAEWTEADVADLAAVLKGLLLKFDALFGRPFPYMMVIHQAPSNGPGGPGDDGDAHLHFEFYSPLRTAEKLKFLAGCESGAGTFINDTLPEERAEALRRSGPRSVAAVREPAAASRRLALRRAAGLLGRHQVVDGPAVQVAHQLPQLGQRRVVTPAGEGLVDERLQLPPRGEADPVVRLGEVGGQVPLLEAPPQRLPEPFGGRQGLRQGARHRPVRPRLPPLEVGIEGIPDPDGALRHGAEPARCPRGLHDPWTRGLPERDDLPPANPPTHPPDVGRGAHPGQRPGRRRRT